MLCLPIHEIPFNESLALEIFQFEIITPNKLTFVDLLNVHIWRIIKTLSFHKENILEIRSFDLLRFKRQVYVMVLMTVVFLTLISNFFYPLLNFVNVPHCEIAQLKVVLLKSYNCWRDKVSEILRLLFFGLNSLNYCWNHLRGLRRFWGLINRNWLSRFLNYLFRFIFDLLAGADVILMSLHRLNEPVHVFKILLRE